MSNAARSSYFAWNVPSMPLPLRCVPITPRTIRHGGNGSTSTAGLAGDAMGLRRGTPTRESVLDLVFEVRPLFTGPIPDGMQKCGPLQDEVMAAANDLRQLLPGEKGAK